MKFTLKAALAIVLVACGVSIATQVHLPGGIHLFSLGGSTSASADESRIKQAFTSQQGLVAGYTDYTDLGATVKKQAIGFLPTWVAGSCVSTTGGQGTVTYSSNFTQTPPTVTTEGTKTKILLPEPTPLAVAVTNFKLTKVHSDWRCGLLLGQIDTTGPTQTLNAQLQKTLCDKAYNDESQKAARENDAIGTALTIVRDAGGAETSTEVGFQSVDSPKRIEGCS